MTAVGQSQRFYVRDFAGVICATRNRGRRVAENLERIAAENDGAIVISFEGVEAATVPFMDEVLSAITALGERASYSALNEDVQATLAVARKRRRR